MKHIHLLFALVVVVSFGMWSGCEDGGPSVGEVDQRDIPVVNRTEFRAHLEAILTRIAGNPESVDAGLLDELMKGPVLLNRIPAFSAIEPYILDESGRKYRIVLSRFVGSRDDGLQRTVFALDPDRFGDTKKPLIGYRLAAKRVLQKKELEMEAVHELTARSKVPYTLIFIDVERQMSLEENIALWDEMIKGSKIFREYGIRDAKSAVCYGCDEGGGGGGGGGGGPKPYLVLKYIKLKYDMDAGDDECELYIRESDPPFGIPGDYVSNSTGLIFSGDVRYDAAGRSRWFPNLNNAGDVFGGLDIALFPLSNDYSVSIVGIEDDDDQGIFDNDYGGGSPTFNMYWEYRRDQNSYYQNIPRGFYDGDNCQWYDCDDVWQTSHFANFMDGNMTEGQILTLSLGDFDVQVTKEIF